MAQATSVLIAVAVLHHVINQAVRQLTLCRVFWMTSMKTLTADAMPRGPGARLEH